MGLQKVWLKCTVVEGMLPEEYAVSCNSLDGNTFSFFASEEYIDINNNLVQVDIMERQSEGSLVYIPFDPLEGISRTVKVSTKDLVSYGT